MHELATVFYTHYILTTEVSYHADVISLADDHG